MSLENKIIGLVGGGNMAKAIAEGILKKGLVKSPQLIVSSPTETTLDRWRKFNINVTHSNEEIVNKADIVIFCVKPYQLDAVMEDLQKSFKSQSPKNNSTKIYVSVLAGVTSKRIFDKLRQFLPICKVIRVMPNTPVSVCEGCTAVAPGPGADIADVQIVKTIFSATGKCEIVQENIINAITGLTGSGPAFVYTIIEALSDGAVKHGLPRDLATTFAAQTLLGSAKMVLETQKHPGQLKDEVCSAGGTTIHGIHALEKGKLRAALMDAVEAAVRRGIEMEKVQQ